MIKALILSMMLAFGPATGTGQRAVPVFQAPVFDSPQLQRAYDLFIPIACTNSEFIRFEIGTGFPVAEHLVMTAKHVDCGDAITEISTDGGHTWFAIPREHLINHGKADVKMIYVGDQKFTTPAVFRTGHIGEPTFGYGIAFGHTATIGSILKSDNQAVVASNTAIGGMSGSALVGKNGDVVGMVVQAVPTIVGGDIPSAWLSLCIPAATLQHLLETFKEQIEPGLVDTSDQQGVPEGIPLPKLQQHKQ